MTDAPGERPYLEGIPLDRTEIVIEWASYLGRTFGTAGALAVLRHYERLSWLSPAARRDVERHLDGLSLDDRHPEGAERSHDLSGPLAALSGTPFAPHARSLAYVAMLAGDDLEDDVLRATVAKRGAGVADAAEVRSSDRE